MSQEIPNKKYRTSIGSPEGVARGYYWTKHLRVCVIDLTSLLVKICLGCLYKGNIVTTDKRQ